MDTALIFIFLLRCCCVGSLPRAQSASFSLVFSDGTLLLVDVGEKVSDWDEDHLYHHHSKRRGSAPSIQILSSMPLSRNPASPQVLVCVLTGLASPQEDVLWWVDDTVAMLSDIGVSWARSEVDGAYSATSVWQVSAADRLPGSTYWCGTVQEGRVFREKVCCWD